MEFMMIRGQNHVFSLFPTPYIHTSFLCGVHTSSEISNYIIFSVVLPFKEIKAHSGKCECHDYSESLADSPIHKLKNYLWNE